MNLQATGNSHHWVVSTTYSSYRRPNRVAEGLERY